MAGFWVIARIAPSPLMSLLYSTILYSTIVLYDMYHFHPSDQRKVSCIYFDLYIAFIIAVQGLAIIIIIMIKKASAHISHIALAQNVNNIIIHPEIIRFL